MDQIVIKKYKRRFWDIAEIYKNHVLIAKVNMFYSVNSEWIHIFETWGGQGTGYEQGGLIKKIFIGDCELTVENIED